MNSFDKFLGTYNGLPLMVVFTLFVVPGNAFHAFRGDVCEKKSHQRILPFETFVSRRRSTDMQMSPASILRYIVVKCFEYEIYSGKLKTFHSNGKLNGYISLEHLQKSCTIQP